MLSAALASESAGKISSGLNQKLPNPFVRNYIMTLVALPVSALSVSQSEAHPLQPSGSIQHSSHVALFLLGDHFTSFKKTVSQTGQHTNA